MLKTHPSSSGGVAIGSLVVLIASISATGALASAPPVNPESLERGVSARVASVAAIIEKNGPPGLRDRLGPEMKIAQWRNR